jgi:LEA14-like dessication related protein
MKKVILIASIILTLASCAGLQIPEKPGATIKDFDIQSISLQDITLLFDVEISNPYPVPLKLDSASFTFFVENKQFLKTAAGQGLNLTPRGVKSSVFTVNLKYADIVKIVKDYAARDYLNCMVDMVITIPLPEIARGLPKNLTFNYKLEKKIPAIKPTISIENFRVQMPSENDIIQALNKSGRSLADKARIYSLISSILSGRDPGSVLDLTSLDLKLKVNFDILMKNHTKARLDFQNLDYDFLLNGSKLVDGSTKDIRNSGSVSVLQISNEFSTKSMGRPLLNAFKSKTASFQLKGAALVKMPDEIRKTPLSLKFDEKGGLSL